MRCSLSVSYTPLDVYKRQGQRSGAEPVEPMYTVQDAEAAMKLFVGKAYEQRFQLAPGLEARFVRCV